MGGSNINCVDDERQKLAAEISRLENTCERMEKMGLTSISSGGTSRTFIDYDKLRNRLSKLRHRMKCLLDGRDPQIKTIINILR